MKINLTLLHKLRKPRLIGGLVFGLCLGHYLTSTSFYETTVAVTLPPGASAEESPAEIPQAVLDSGFAALDAERAKAGLAVLDTDAVADKLETEFDEDSQTLHIQYRSPNREEAESILNALATAFVEQSREMKSVVAAPRLEQLQYDRQQTEQQLASARELVTQIEAESADMAYSPTAQQASLERLKTFSEQLAAVRAQRLQAEARYRDAAHELENGAAVKLVAAQISDGSAKEVVEAAMTQADVAEALRQVRQTKLELSRFYGARHPRMIEVIAKEAELARQINDAESAGGGLIQQASATQPETDRRQLLLDSLAFDLHRHQNMEAELQEQIELEQAQLNRQNELQEQLQTAQQDVAAAEQRLQAVSHEFETTRDKHRALAAIVAPAATGDTPVSPSFLGHLLWGCLAAVAVSRLSRWAFRDLKDAEAEAEPVPAVESPAESDLPDQPPLYARRLMRLARLARQQEAEEETE